ncbi:MAG TPA: DNA mismatch repair protein MutS [Planctomycetota bacterium]|nr:DNA mismatch repair protein MutS [Planctomycetota bacterium]
MRRSSYLASSGAAAERPAPAPRETTGLESSASALTPMMRQFHAAKKEAPDALLFFRMGDFYEMFGEDAVVAARELGITLTSRSKGLDALPMAGVPVRAVESYLLRLVHKGFKVAICEQMQDPRDVKGIVDRAIVRVVSAGTLTEEEALDARANNYLASIAVAGDRVGIAWVDLSTGRCSATETDHARACDELARIAPAELLCATTLAERAPLLAAEVERVCGPRQTQREEWRFEREGMRRALERHFKLATLEGFGIEDDSLIIPAAGALVEYLQETQKSACDHVRRIERVDSSEFLALDRATRSCLELVATQRDARRDGSVLEVIDASVTPMGGRMVREWLLSPLRRPEPILLRQRGVAEFVASPFLRGDVRELLGDVLDIERLVAKLSTARANARDLVGLAASLEIVPRLRAKLESVYSKILGELLGALDPLEDVALKIRATLVDAPPLGLREGGLVRPGRDAQLDELRQIAGDGKSWMAGFQADEIARTGMNNLKIGFNSVFGYFIEIPHGQTDRVPPQYIRKQTVKNAERYITPELKEFETKVLKSEELSFDLEYKLFCELRDEVARHVGRILDTANALATIDVLAALAQRAAESRYCAPDIDQGDVIRILDGRHPVIERTLSGETFVPNDSLLDRGARRITILTGPNMAGKSTYIRQTALIVLLAQIGSFVPAREAKIGLVDRIFTRVGSSDDIARHQSTFMVEMVEVANILNNATARSLVVLDEVGRGTSTFDGLALAWAIVEHLFHKVGARAMFATHYHQLTALSESLPGVFNQSVAVREWEDQIVFLHKIVDGGTDRSYGIHVARLAGVPGELLLRAKEILAGLESDAEGLGPRIAGSRTPPAIPAAQLSLFEAPPTRLESALKKLDPDRLTPIDALIALRDLKRLL